MTKSFLLCLLFITRFPAFSQQDEATADLLQKLDSVQVSPLISRHFAEMYYNTTAKAVLYFSAAKKPVQVLMQRFEERFAGYFIAAANAYKQKDKIPAAAFHACSISCWVPMPISTGIFGRPSPLSFPYRN